MLQIERILCPVDFSVFSARAYDYAQSLARHYQAKLLLQHVIEFNLPIYAYYVPASYMVDQLQQVRNGAMSQLHEFAKRPADYGTPPERILNEGAPADTILSFAGVQKVNLIVMGSHGLQGADRTALGSVTEKVLRKACCSVLVVRSTILSVLEVRRIRSSCTSFSSVRIFLNIQRRPWSTRSP
jgi:nucleotide-binding universal stress UspA family protein